MGKQQYFFTYTVLPILMVLNPGDTYKKLQKKWERVFNTSLEGGILKIV